MALAFTSIHEQPFPLCHYCEIDSLSHVTSATQTDDRQGKVRTRIDGPELSTEVTVITSVTTVHCVLWHCHAEGLLYMTDVQVFQEIAMCALDR